MAKILCIMGESGSGKTTSMRNLDPATTFYFDCDKKGLSWKGWRKQYIDGKNYRATDEQDRIKAGLEYINAHNQFNTVIVDTLNGIMVADEMRRSAEKNYDKWMDLAVAVYNIIDYALKMRDDITVIFTAHTQTDHDESGYLFTRIKTSGKKLDKICLESKFPIVLHSKVIDGRYVFETKANFSTAKTPMGAFDRAIIDNDIKEVLKALEEF